MKNVLEMITEFFFQFIKACRFVVGSFSLSVHTFQYHISLAKVRLNDKPTNDQSPKTFVLEKNQENGKIIKENYMPQIVAP